MDFSNLFIPYVVDVNESVFRSLTQLFCSGWPRKSRSTSGVAVTRGYWRLGLTDFCNFFILYIFEVKESISVEVRVIRISVEMSVLLAKYVSCCTLCLYILLILYATNNFSYFLHSIAYRVFSDLTPWRNSDTTLSQIPWFVMFCWVYPETCKDQFYDKILNRTKRREIRWWYISQQKYPSRMTLKIPHQPQAADIFEVFLSSGIT